MDCTQRLFGEGVVVIPCGSYRRGCGESSDVDLLLSHRDGESHKGTPAKAGAAAAAAARGGGAGGAGGGSSLIQQLLENLRGAKNGIFFGVFPMFVPSLSWQNDHFYI